MSTQSRIARQHYAFLVSEAEFDDIFGRIRAQNLMVPENLLHPVPENLPTRFIRDWVASTRTG